MADELPEKVRDAIAKGPQRLYPCPRCNESGSVMGPSFMQRGATVEQDCRTCYGTGKLLELPEAFAERIARLAIEESTRSIREKLENAEEGYARRHKDATDLWEKINFPGGLNAQILELRERLERSQSFVRTYSKLRYNGLSPDVAIAALESTDHALAIREAKKENT